MKKTLIALAVLAASGASFAQVTISGNLAMGYQASSVAKADKSGLGVDTSQIDFAATEDLGGGMKAIAKMSLAGADRSGESGNGTVGGRNASLALVTNVGVFSLGSTKAADYLSGGVAGVGALYSSFDSLEAGATGLFSARSNRDTATYTLPLGAFTLAVSSQEGGNNQGLGTGAAGVQHPAQRLTAYIANYASGPVTADIQYLAYDQAAVAGALGGDSTVKNVQRLSGAYDLRFAKVGLGVQVQNNLGGATSSKATQTLVGISAPFGAVSLGAQWGQRKTEDYTVLAQNGTRSGYGLGLTYSLSKRTSVVAQYSRWDNANFVDADNSTTVLLSHSF